MEELILWAVPVVGALAGASCRFLRSYLVLAHFLFASYVAVWSEGAISSFYTLPPAAAPYQPAITMLATAAALLVVLIKLSEQLLPGNKVFAFPGPVDKLGGAACGFLSGLIAINFVVFLFCTTPQKIRAQDASLSLPALEQVSSRNLLLLAEGVDLLSFQLQTPEQRREKLERLIRLADPPPPEEEEENADGATDKDKASSNP